MGKYCSCDISMSIFRFIGHIPVVLLGKTCNWWQGYIQTSSSSNACLKNNVLKRKKILAKIFLYKSVKVHSSVAR